MILGAKMKNRYMLLLLTLPILAFAGMEVEQQSGHIINQISKEGIESSSAYKTKGHKKQGTYFQNYEETVYEYLKKYSKSSEKKEGHFDFKEDKKFAFDIDKKRRDDENRSRALALALQKKAEKEKREERKQLFRYGHGYCYMDQEAIIDRIATYAYLSCDLNHPIGKVNLAVSLVPEYYAKAIVANPLYVLLDDETRLPVKNGVVMTKDRNSINLANFVNDRRIEKMWATGMYKGVGIVAKRAQAFLDQKYKSDTSQTSTVVGSINPTVTTSSKTKEPKFSDALVVAGIEFTSEIAKILGESYVQNLHYTFKVNKGRVFYVDLEFASDGAMEGYKIDQSNGIIREEPTFTDGIESKPTIVDIPVVNNHLQSNKIEGVRPSSTKIALPPAQKVDKNDQTVINQLNPR